MLAMYWRASSGSEMRESRERACERASLSRAAALGPRRDDGDGASEGVPGEVVIWG
jgi:hypothetical protein